MIPLKDNQDVASFLVTKHSWKGKYKRVFSVGTHGITTYNPDRLEVTNRWLYADVITVASAKHSNSALNHDFTLVMKKDKKVDSMKFSSEHKCLILTEAFKYRHLFAEKPKDIFRFQAYKHHWSGTRLPVVLEVSPCSLEQLDPSTHSLLASYPYADIQGILPVKDVPGGFVLAVGGYSRLHLFSHATEHQVIINKMLEMANLTLSISIKVLATATITLEDYHNQRFGKYSGDQHQTSLSEFVVHKVSPARHMEPMRRTLCLSDTCLLERDPQTYSVVCLRPLSDVFALVRDPEHPQRFSIEYLNGQTRTYLAGERDALLASLMDGVRSAGQRDVHARSTPSQRALRLGPPMQSVDEETESNHLRLFQNPVGMSRVEVIDRFNANVGYSGLIYSVSQDRLFAENKEKLITGALSALVNSAPSTALTSRELEAQFHALRRLCASKVGFAAFTALPGFREWIGTSVVAALRRDDAACSHAALDAVCALMQPMHSEPELRQEQLNKASMLSSQPFLEGLLHMWAQHTIAGTGALVVAAMLDLLTFALCVPYSETTDGKQFDQLLEMVAARGRVLFKLFEMGRVPVVAAMLDLLTFALCVPYSETTDGKQFDQLLEMVAARGRVLFKLFEHPSMAIVKGAGLIMRALVEEGGNGVGTRMQSLALAEAALPRHLVTALYAPARLQHRHLARHLVALWLVDHAPATHFMKRIMPSGLLSFLESTELPPTVKEQTEERDNLPLLLQAPSGLLSFLESTELPPTVEEQTEERDNLQLAQATVKRTAPHWEPLDRQLKYIEKHIEHYAQLALQHWAMRGGRVSQRERADAIRERPVVLRRRRERVKSTANWPMFYYQFHRDHALPNLIWNHTRADAIRERPVVLRRRRERVKSTANWPMFYYQFHRDHALPNLIWNHTTREELRNALENELRSFASDREVAGNTLISWNHSELEVHYQCLQNEVKIGDYYLRVLLEQRDSEDSPIRKSYEFFNDLYHRFLSTPKVEMKCMCLQAMSIVYGRYYEDIGPFADTKYIVQMLDRTCDRMERDRLVQFLAKLILHRRNVSEILEWNGIRILVELMTLAHLHTSRATMPTQSNVIEGGAHTGGGDREWYYNAERNKPVSVTELKELYEKGEITNKTKCWANSMEGWRALGAVPQLKWTLAARGTAVWDETALAGTVLDLLITAARYYPSRDEEDAVIRPLPKVKRLLSEPACLAHVVQLLLTFDPILVEKVATLLYEVMQDNPEISKLYLTGVFYFMLLYTGSNLLPIARFLRLTHMKQAFRADQSSSDIMQRSILGALLPEAMVCYLENHGPDKFAQIYLGEYDTPEAIWNSEMRRMLMMKISAHIGEFTPRLRAHIAARYPYLAIPAVNYPQLQSELFCNMFYLRHLCDTARFPDWPIPEPVQLLKDVLEAWRREVEKKPPSMSLAAAYSALGLGAGAHDEAAVRRAYYRLAQLHHPDKNPEGRDRFEEVNQAYEFLCSRTAWTGDGPSTDNIVLILRTQTILFQRYSDVLAPYKYAGYPQLLRTVRLETEAERLFSATGSALLPAACELAHATVRCSALNAEQLARDQGILTEAERQFSATGSALLPAACELARATVRCSALNAEQLARDQGILVLHEAMTRCVSVLSSTSSQETLASSVCAHCSRCFAVAAQFPSCLQVMSELPLLCGNLIPLLTRPNLGDTACAGAEAVAALAVDPLCRAALVQAGAVHALIPLVLRYDYTLTESGVDTTQANTNKQEVANTLARLSVQALAALYGPHDTRGAEDVRVCSTLHTLLTPYLCRRLHTSAPHEVTQQALAALYGPHDTRGAEDVRVCSTVHTLLTPYLCRRLHTSAPHEVTQQALAALYGPHDTRGAEDVRVCSTLHTLLTPYLCRRLHTSAPHELLKTLTSNWRTPYLVWDNSVRAELSAALETAGLTGDVTGLAYSAHEGLLPVGHVYLRIYNQRPDEPIEVCRAAELLYRVLQKGIPFLQHPVVVEASTRERRLTGDVTGLAYSAHEGLLPVGHVYLRIYNQRPDEPIENPQQFVLDLLQFISEQTAADLSAERVEHITMALTALSNCIIKNPGVEIQCIGQFGLLFGLLSARAHSGVQQAALAAVLAAAGNRAVLEDIAATHVLGHLLALVGTRPPPEGALPALSALLANTSLVKEALAKGAVIYLLDIFCNSKVPETREAAVEILASMMSDKLHGPKVRLTISRYIPAVFAEAMCAGAPQSVIHMMDSRHEHPELVWSDEARATVAATVAACRDRHQSKQLRDPNALFEDSTNTQNAQWTPPGEVAVGGVYLRLFLQNPQWSVRAPKKLLQELLTETLATLPKDCSEGSRGDVCAQALAALLRTRPALADACAQLGELPRLARLLPACPRQALPVLAAVAGTQSCVTALSSTDVMAGVRAAVKSCRDVAGVACEALAAIFSSSANTDRLVSQALETDLIGELLSLLESGLDGQTAAQLVNALKAMSRSQLHGERVKSVLSRSRVWEQYAAQRHDLFITSTNNCHQLTGAPPSAGYLTAPPTNIQAQPPPID